MFLNQQINELKKCLSGCKEELNAILVQVKSNLNNPFAVKVFVKKPVDEFNKKLY